MHVSLLQWLKRWGGCRSAERHIAAGRDLETEAQNGAPTESAASQQRWAEVLTSVGLSKIARLDTCVTVIDAVNCMADFNTADFLADRHRKASRPLRGNTAGDAMEEGAARTGLMLGRCMRGMIMGLGSM